LRYLAAVLFLLMSVIAHAGETTFIFAHINESVMPIERGAKYEDPLDAFLKSRNIGEITGGGSSLSKSGNIEWIGVDIELADPQKNITVLVQKLKDLGAPSGSYLEFTVNDKYEKVPIK
jgi:hypothetical protein